MGSVAVTGTVVVDLYRPVLTAPASLTTTVGHPVQLSYTVRDPYSGTVRVRANVVDAQGETIRSASLGWVTRNKAHTWSYTPATAGTYTITLTATDRGGNREKTPVRTSLTVR